MNDQRDSKIVTDNRQDEGETRKPDSSLDNQQKDTKNRRANSGHQEQPSSKGSWKGWYRNPELVFAACIVAFTGILTVTTIYQWKTMETTLATDQRAWLGPNEVKLTTPKVMEPLRADLKIVNFGKGVALDSRIDLTMVQSPAPIDVEQVAVSEERKKQSAKIIHNPAVIFPNQQIDASVLGTPLIPNEEGIENIKARKWLIYVIGEVYYSDIFKKSHVTKLCMLYNPNSSRFDLCEKYNTAD